MYIIYTYMHTYSPILIYILILLHVYVYTGCASYNLETIPAYRKAIIGLEQGAENM